MRGYIVPLGDAGQRDLPLVGGKGAGLGDLLRAGFPVPPGFVVTTAAYAEFVTAGGLGDADPGRLRARIPLQPIPVAVAEAVRAAYRDLGEPAVAVRSSGTAEDLADASFAGQHDTYLNVTGADAVLAAVRDCWASLWTPRAVAYRRRQGWDERGLALAVVVQAMVDPEWAGVLFTADPVSGRRDRVVVEAVRGLGDALVSGEATGDHLVVDKRTGRLLTGASRLPAGLPAELARLGTRVEQAFGRPQDVEWTYAGGRCSLVQARPLTGLPDEPARRTGHSVRLPRRTPRPRRPRRPRRTRRPPQPTVFAAEHMPYPPYPVDVSLTVRPAARAVLRGLWSAGFSVPGLDEVLVEVGDGVVQPVPPRPRPTARVLLRAPATLGRLAALARTRPSDWRARCDATVGRLVRELEAADLVALSDGELLDRVEELRRAQAALVPSRFGVVVPRAIVADRVLGELLRLGTGRERAERLHAELMAGIPCVTRDADRALDRLAATIRDTPDLARVYREAEPAAVSARLGELDTGRALLAGVDAYLRRYGFRQLTEPLVGFAPLREAPAVLHGLLKSLATSGRADETDDDARAERAQGALRHGVRNRVLAPLTLRLLATARAGVGVREDSHFHLFMVVSATMRRPILELGRRLAERGTLAETGDVLYLEVGEMRSLSPERTRATVHRRKTAREAALDGWTMLPADLLGATGDTDAVRGTPASRGRVVGAVRVVRGEADFAKLGAGEVLVCPYTNPAWTPLFSLAAAVVADAGGAASHTAIVAREYGIPAVMGTRTGTRALTDGQRVLVDGDAGTVVPLDRVPHPGETAGAAEPVAAG